MTFLLAFLFILPVKNAFADDDSYVEKVGNLPVMILLKELIFQH